MAKPQFTFKNYLKELKQSWLIIVIFVVLGAAGGAFLAFTKPNNYLASAKLSVYNPAVNTGPQTSPYAQISELLMSDELVEGNLETYTVIEKPFGVFQIDATSTDSQKAIDTVNTVMDHAEDVIKEAFEDAENYRITILSRASEAEPTIVMKQRIISTVITTVGALALALVVIFVKFDYKAEK